jgi:hypothetical protein
VPKRLNLSGKILEFLTVIDFSHIGKDGRSYWNCLCCCGNKIIINSTFLYEGSRSSCGCKRRYLQTLKRGMDLSELAYRTIFNDYRSGAKNKNREFELDFEYFEKLLKSNCFYCGTPPLLDKTVENGYGKLTIKYNGVDRKNNNIGYTVENCVTACKLCNYAKKAMSYENFVAWLDRITKFRIHVIT